MAHLQILIFWDVILCHWLSGSLQVKDIHCLSKCNEPLTQQDSYIQDDLTPQYTPLWKPQILQ